VLYAAAGVLHLFLPAPFLSIMPNWIPFPAAVVAVTGICEIAGAVGLSIPRWRRSAGLWLAVYAVCVFPANIQHAMQDLGSGSGLGLLYHGPRLALQPVLAWLALYCSSQALRIDKEQSGSSRHARWFGI
jgi:uncharacterized membrane protein